MSENLALPDRLPDTAKTVLIFANPKAGSGKHRAALEQLSAELAQRRFSVCNINAFDELAGRAAELQQQNQLRAIVSAGGDGTAAEIVNRTPPGAPLAIFPMGTANLLANYLEITPDPAQFAAIIAQRHTAWLDAGQANGRLFLLVAGVGFDAEVVNRLHAARSGNIRGWAYAKPIWQAIRNYTYPALRASCAMDHELPVSETGASGVVAGLNTSAGNDNAAPVAAGHDPGADSAAVQPVPNVCWSEPIHCRWAFVFNISRYAGGLNFAPQASGVDGQLDLCTFQRGGLLPSLKYLMAILRRRHGELSEFIGQRGLQFRIESDEPVPYELDGDPGGTLPLTIEVVPRRLRLLVPVHWPSPAKTD